MKIKEHLVKYFIFEYKGEFKKSGTKIVNLKNDETEILQYDGIEIQGHLSKLYIKDGKLEVKFGCQKVTEEDIIMGYDQLMGKDTATTRKGLKKGPKGKVLTTNIIEESENFYISSSGKIYNKSEYVPAEFKHNPKIVYENSKSYWVGDRGWKFREQTIGKGEKTKFKLIELFEYYIEIIQFLKSRNELQTK